MKDRVKLLIIVTFLCCFFTFSNGIIFLRPKNDRGPGTCLKCVTFQTIVIKTLIHFEGATQAGFKCIEHVERYFFKNAHSVQVQNLAVFHSSNMTSPAMEIEIQYLFELHDRILHIEEEEERFQLKVISNVKQKISTDHLLDKDVILTNLYVIVGDSLKRINQNIKSISLTKSFNEEAKFLILINDPENRKLGKVIAWEILNTLFTKYRAVNVVVLYAVDAFSYDIYTSDPYHGSEVDCGKMKALHIGKCANGKLIDRKATKRHLMADKVPVQMSQCTFNFCARVQEPFVNEGCKDGLEIQIMRMLQAEMGFQINTTCSELDRGEPNDNGTWSDLLGEVRDDKCDVIAGAFFPDHDVHADFAATEFYLQDFYTFYVRKAGLEPRWKGLITIFKIRAWTAFGVVLVVSWLFWYIMGIISGEAPQHRQILLTFLNVFAVSLGVSANNRPINSPLRVFFSILALYALTITAIYTSKLITVFTNPKYNHQINSIKEILESGLPIGGRQENMDWFDNEDDMDQEIFLQYNHSDIFRPSTKSLRQIRDGKMTLIISKLYVGSNLLRNDVFGLTQSMFSNNLEMIVERGFPLLRRINEILSALRDMGLMSKLFVDFKYNMTILTPIREMKALIDRQDPTTVTAMGFDDDQTKEEENPEIVLTTEHLEGAFTLLLAGIVASSAVFLLEIILHSHLFNLILKWIWTKLTCQKPKKQVVFKSSVEEIRKKN